MGRFAEPKHRVYVTIQTIFGLTAIIFFLLDSFGKWLPPPGVAVAIIAVVAAAMSIHSDMEGSHKAVWMLIIGAFLFLEMSAIVHEREEQTKQQQMALAEERKHFNEIGDDLKATIQKSDLTLDGLHSAISGIDSTLRVTNRTLSKAEETIKTETGGDSHVGVIPALLAGKTEFPLMIAVAGDNPMWDVHVSYGEYPDNAPTMDEFGKYLEGTGNEHVIYTGSSISPGALFATSTKISPDPNRDQTVYYVNTRARNGSTQEILKVRFDKPMNKWLFSCSVARLVGQRKTRIMSGICRDRWTGVDVHLAAPAHP